MLKLQGTREQMLLQISKNKNAKEARIMTKPSKALFFNILQRTQVERIYMSRGIYATVPKKVLDALKSAGVFVHIMHKKVGRPPKISHEKKLEALRRLRKGISAAKISRELNIPSTSVYAWIRRMKKKPVKLLDST